MWYFEPNTFPEDRKIRWLGETHKIGQARCFWVITSTGKLIARSSVKAISEAGLSTGTVVKED